jgi:hypothetical protein
MTSVGSELPKEMARVRDVVIPQYESIGPSGALAIGLMKLELDRAAVALAEGDLPAILRSYAALKEFES